MTLLAWVYKVILDLFELKIRILNRILTLTKDGLVYEADPRHVDLLSGSLGLTDANSVLTPGVKDPEPDYQAEKTHEDEHDSMKDQEEKVQALRTDHRKIRFKEEINYFSVPAYGEIYGCHPRYIAATSDGWRTVSAHADPFTSKSGIIMRSRCARIHNEERQNKARNDRRGILRLLHAKLVSALYAIRTAPAKKHGAKRAGAKKVKAMERIPDAYTLSPEDATNFRALSARANFLSQDRTDIGFSTKELCREFAVPNKNSYNRLKRVARYLAGKPRLVYNYLWGTDSSEPDKFDIYVDTDFAGCKESRRSTSGGICMFGGSNIKHWAKTQSTIALSSGEAELHGIAAGITQGLGMQSIARDLGFKIAIRVHTDATAALGICRRRGLGKIRHLDVTDLWCQEKVREVAVELVKVLGSENPADIMTKYTDRAILDKMLKLAGLSTLDGRAECAPMAAGC